MPFIPHTKTETQVMLEAIGVSDIDDLFDEIPANLRIKDYQRDLGLSELETLQMMVERANQDGTPVCFAGAGAYDHHIPAAVWEITTRGEFYSAYTPYQAEASQGTLQLLYEFQTMMANIMAMDVSNTSLYDGASGLGEAILMAVRANRKSKSKKILVPKSTHPDYRKVANTIVKNQKIELVELDYEIKNGTITVDSLSQYAGEDYAALVIPFPNYFGKLEEVDALTNWAHENGLLVIAQVNPLAMTWLTPPGDWGGNGADIVCGEGQPMGVPLSSGGPYFGFLCCTQKLVRQMPGRLIGKTEDLDGNPGYTLTLQAREQHIRRSKATSNICTNQGLLVTAATIHMAIMGENGLKNSAIKSHENTQVLLERLTKIKGVEEVFAGHGFHEFVLQLPADTDKVISLLAAQNIVAGVNISEHYEAFENVILVCATEKRTLTEIEDFASKLEKIVKELSC